MTYETDNIGLGAGLENAGTIIVTGDRNIAVYAKHLEQAVHTQQQIAEQLQWEIQQN